jgi:RES domain-containing protein
MLLYRIVTSRVRASDLSGTGAWLVGGRWNPVGVHALYTSENPALAMLEVLVHADARDLPETLFLACLELDGEAPVRSVGEEELPADWRVPDHLGLKQMGKGLLADPSHIGFSAPSAVMPVQRILILHPGHPMFQRYVKLIDVREIRPDARLLV